MLIKMKNNRVKAGVVGILCRMKIWRYEVSGGFVNVVIIVGFK